MAIPLSRDLVPHDIPPACCGKCGGRTTVIEAIPYNQLTGSRRRMEDECARCGVRTLSYFFESYVRREYLPKAKPMTEPDDPHMQFLRGKAAPWPVPDVATNRFAYTAFSEDARAADAVLAEAAKRVEQILLSLPKSREQATALTKLEETIMWARKGLREV